MIYDLSQYVFFFSFRSIKNKNDTMGLGLFLAVHTFLSLFAMER